MIAWMRDPANHVLYETYFDYDGRGTNSVITGGQFPHSLDRLPLRVQTNDTFGHRVPEGVSGPSGSFVAGAVSLAGGMGLHRRRRRVRRERRVEPLPRRIYPPAHDVGASSASASGPNRASR